MKIIIFLFNKWRIQWSYLLFDTLINKILNGKQSVQEPIRLYNLSQTKTNNISFLNHLLMYESVNKG